MSLNQDLAREVEEYWSRAEARLESLDAMLGTTNTLLDLDAAEGLTPQQKTDLTAARSNIINAAIAGIQMDLDQYTNYIQNPIEDRAKLPDENRV